MAAFIIHRTRIQSSFKAFCYHHVSQVIHFLDSLFEILASTDVHVAITTDSWTSRAVESYLTVTVHYITSDWKLESKVLQTREMPKRHTALNIAERLQDCISEWNIDKERVSAIMLAILDLLYKTLVGKVCLALHTLRN